MAQVLFTFQAASIEVHYKMVKPKPNNGFSGTYFSFDTSTQAAANKNSSQVIIVAKFNIRDEDKPEILASFIIACGFTIGEFAEKVVFSDNDTRVAIDEKVVKVLSVPALSTCRGIIYSELKGTYLQSAIMPVIDVNTLQKSDSHIIEANNELNL